MEQNAAGDKVANEAEVAEQKAAEAAAKAQAKEEAKQAAAAKRAEEAAARKAAKEAEKAEAKAARERAAQEKREAKEREAAEKKAQREAARGVMQNGLYPPKPETLCGKAWAVFDEVSQKKGSPASIAESLELARTRSLNEGNVRTEYARWRKYHGVTGRIVVTPPAVQPGAAAGPADANAGTAASTEGAPAAPARRSRKAAPAADAQAQA